MTSTECCNGIYRSSRKQALLSVVVAVAGKFDEHQKAERDSIPGHVLKKIAEAIEHE